MELVNVEAILPLAEGSTDSWNCNESYRTFPVSSVLCEEESGTTNLDSSIDFMHISMANSFLNQYMITEKVKYYEMNLEQCVLFSDEEIGEMIDERSLLEVFMPWGFNTNLHGEFQNRACKMGRRLISNHDYGCGYSPLVEKMISSGSVLLYMLARWDKWAQRGEPTYVNEGYDTEYYEYQLNTRIGRRMRNKIIRAKKMHLVSKFHHRRKPEVYLFFKFLKWDGYYEWRRMIKLGLSFADVRIRYLDFMRWFSASFFEEAFSWEFSEDESSSQRFEIVELDPLLAQGRTRRKLQQPKLKAQFSTLEADSYVCLSGDPVIVNFEKWNDFSMSTLFVDEIKVKEVKVGKCNVTDLTSGVGNFLYELGYFHSFATAGKSKRGYLAKILYQSMGSGVFMSSAEAFYALRRPGRVQKAVVAHQNVTHWFKFMIRNPKEFEFVKKGPFYRLMRSMWQMTKEDRTCQTNKEFVKGLNIEAQGGFFDAFIGSALGWMGTIFQTAKTLGVSAVQWLSSFGSSLKTKFEEMYEWVKEKIKEFVKDTKMIMLTFRIIVALIVITALYKVFDTINLVKEYCYAVSQFLWGCAPVTGREVLINDKEVIEAQGLGESVAGMALLISMATGEGLSARSLLTTFQLYNQSKGLLTTIKETMTDIFYYCMFLITEDPVWKNVSFTKQLGELAAEYELFNKEHPQWKMSSMGYTVVGPSIISRYESALELERLMITATSEVPQTLQMARTLITALRTDYKEYLKMDPKWKLRREPAVVWLAGPPKQGKTESSRFLSHFVYEYVKARGMKIEGMKMPAYSESQVFSKPKTSQYYDGYRNQFTFTTPEFNAVQDKVARGLDGVAFLEMADGTPMPLDMSAVEDKGIYFFLSRLFISTSNFKDFANCGMTDVDAVTRRMMFCLEVNKDKHIDLTRSVTIEELDTAWTFSPHQFDDYKQHDETVKMNGKPIRFSELVRRVGDMILRIERERSGGSPIEAAVKLFCSGTGEVDLSINSKSLSEAQSKYHSYVAYGKGEQFLASSLIVLDGYFSKCSSPRKHSVVALSFLKPKHWTWLSCVFGGKEIDPKQVASFEKAVLKYPEGYRLRVYEKLKAEAKKNATSPSALTHFIVQNAINLFGKLEKFVPIEAQMLSSLIAGSTVFSVTAAFINYTWQSVNDTVLEVARGSVVKDKTRLGDHLECRREIFDANTTVERRSEIINAVGFQIRGFASTIDRNVWTVLPNEDMGVMAGCKLNEYGLLAFCLFGLDYSPQTEDEREARAEWIKTAEGQWARDKCVERYAWYAVRNGVFIDRSDHMVKLKAFEGYHYVMGWMGTLVALGAAIGLGWLAANSVAEACEIEGESLGKGHMHKFERSKRPVMQDGKQVITTQADSFLDKCIAASHYVKSIRIKGYSASIIGNGLTSGHSIFVNAHYVSYTGHVSTIEFLDEGNNSITAIGHVIRTQYFEGRDLVRLDFDSKTLQPFPSIKKKLKSRKAEAYQGPVSRVVKRVTSKNGKQVVHYAYYKGKHAAFLSNEEHPMSYADSNGSPQQMIIRSYYRIRECEGMSGDCGFPYVADEEGTHYILGIHLGAVARDTFCAPIYLEDLGASGEMDVALTPGFLQFDVTKKCFPEEILEDGALSFHRMNIKMGIDAKDVSSRKEFMPTESTFRPSVLYESMAQREMVTVGPTRLTFFRNDKGDLIDPHQIGFDKFSTRKWPENNDFIDFVAEKPTRSYKGFFDNTEVIRPWTLKEALETNENTDSMPRDASVTVEYRGKKNSLGEDIKSRKDLWHLDNNGKVVYIDEQLVKDVTCLEEWAADPLKTLQCGATICGKDELTALSNVEIGKTRLFMVAVLSLCMLTKMYLGPILAKMKNSLSGRPSAVGINPLGLQWSLLWDHLNEIPGQNWLAADCKGWDMSVLYFWTWVFWNFLCECYGCTQESRLGQILRNIASSIVGTSFIYMNGVYVLKRGVSSGHYATSFFNTFVNYCIHRGLFNFLKKKVPGSEKKKWKYHVRFVFYGDDNVGKASHHVPWFNMKTLAKAFELYCGMNYTTSAKTEVTECYMNERDIEFLCRGFRLFQYEGVRYVFAPLNKDSIYGMLAWIRKPTNGNTEEGQIRQNIDTALREMFLHGRQEYENFTCVLQRICLESGLGGVKIRPWKMMMRRYINGILSPSKFRADEENACTEEVLASGARSSF